MAKARPIRTDEWQLEADAQTLRMTRDTIVLYRRLANALSSVFLTHWPEVHALPVQDLESLFHTTKKTPDTLYGAWFSQKFYKAPAYLRRAATMAAHGAVSSFMTRYQAWQGGDRATRSQRPPRWGGINTWPVLYAANGGAGAMIRRDDDCVQLKLLDSQTGDWLWRSAVVAKRGKRHTVPGARPLSSTLILRGRSLRLGQPYVLARPQPRGFPDRVCSVDLGINKQATCSIVCADGTVIARTFVVLATHIDRRDKVLSAIRSKARHTMGNGGRLSQGFCQTLYRRAHGLNRHIAQEVSRRILRFARGHGAQTLVFEDLKGFRPKGGMKRSGLRQKFHGWLHRRVVEQGAQSAKEQGLRVAFIHARGTSSWAYDGSGRVKRDRFNYGRCWFASGKEYDCDLSASYNIAARFFAKQTPAGGKTGWPVRGKSSGEQSLSTTGPRTPVTLSSLWAKKSTNGGNGETPTTAAQAA